MNSIALSIPVIQHWLKLLGNQETNTLKVIDTKNHLDHTLPLSDFLYELLQQRKNNAINEYVFQRALKLVMSSEALAAYAKYAGAILVLENQVVCE